MVTEDDFRRLALAQDGATEGAHMRHPDFRANGRIFATLRGDGAWGMVKVTPAEQQVLLREHPAMFEPAAGAWGRQGCTMVNLARADGRTIRAAMSLAWQAVMAAPARTLRKPAREAPGATAGRPVRRSGATKKARSR